MYIKLYLFCADLDNILMKIWLVEADFYCLHFELLVRLLYNSDHVQPIFTSTSPSKTHKYLFVQIPFVVHLWLHSRAGDW